MTIQRVPRGLLDFLGMKGTGDLPHEVAGELRTSIDLFELYGIEMRRRTATTGWAAVAVGWQTDNLGNLTVPPGEIWLVSNVSLAITTGVGGAFKGLVAYRRKLNAATYFYLQQQQLTLAANDFGVTGVNLDWRTLVLTPGDDLGIYCTLATAVVNTPTMYVDYMRLTI